MRVSKYDLCSSCREIRPIMNGGKPSDMTVGELLDSKGNAGMGYFMINQMVLTYLEDDGGCPTCTNLLRQAVQS